MNRRVVLGGLGACVAVRAVTGAMAEEMPVGELVMFRRAGCPWCAVWDREVGPAYPKTDVGRAFPVRMTDLDSDPPADVILERPVRYSPTFVMVVDGREVARIEGYPGQDFFWGLVEKFAAEAAGGEA